jgi:hypothetical protein
MIELLLNETTFYRNESGFVGMKHQDKDYPRVNIIKSFPLSYTDKFISVCDCESVEIGIIPDTNVYPEEARELFIEDIERRYFLPEITKIDSLKQEFGYVYWRVQTTAGEKKFITSKDASAIIALREIRILLIDLDGNRYNITDYTKLDSKSYRLIQLLV